MGLDDFKSTSSSSSSTNNQNEESDDDSDTSESDINIDLDDESQNDSIDNPKPANESDIDFYGTDGFTSTRRPMKRRGGLSDKSRQEVIKSINTKIKIDDDNIKYHLPIFTIITSEPIYESGERYQLFHTKSDTPRAFWHNRPVSCIGTVATELSKMNREIPMFETGSTDKETVIQRINEELSEPINGATKVFINFFGDMFVLRDLAQSNEEYRAGEMVNRQKTIEQALHPHLLNTMVNDND